MGSQLDIYKHDMISLRKRERAKCSEIIQLLKGINKASWQCEWNMWVLLGLWHKLGTWRHQCQDWICSVQEFSDTGLQVKFEHPEPCRCPCLREKNQQGLCHLFEACKSSTAGLCWDNQASFEQGRVKNRKDELASYCLSECSSFSACWIRCVHLPQCESISKSSYCGVAWIR